MKKNNALKLIKTLPIATIATLCSMFSLSANALDAAAYYSDNYSDQVHIIDPRNMTLLSTIQTNGSQPYPIDKVGGNKVYVTTRATQSLDIIDYDGSSFANMGVVALSHFPRSVAYNSNTNLAAVSGTKKAVMSIIDVATDTVIGSVGNQTPLTPVGFGGSLATGHPFWVDDKHFLLIDRARRLVHLYKVKQGQNGAWEISKKSTISTPTSIHHFSAIPNASGWFQKRTFYGMAEGAPNEGNHPSVVRVFVLGNHLLPVGNAQLDQSAAIDQGAHHLAMHPNKTHVYAGSKEGVVYVVNRFSLNTDSVIAAAENAGLCTRCGI